MIVLDASVALSWLLDDEETQALEVLKLAVEGELLLTPAHWWAEVTNALLSAVRRGRAEMDQASRLLNGLDRFCVETYPASVDLYSAVLVTASQFGLTAYDAAYLELARRRGAPLATTDRQLRKAALAAEVPVVPLL